MNDPLDRLQLLRKRLDRLEQARSVRDGFGQIPAVLDGILPLRAWRAFLHVPARRAFEPIEGGADFEVSPTLLTWATTSGEVSSSPAGDGASMLFVPIPGQFKALGVLVLLTDQPAESLDRSTVFGLGLLGRDFGRVMESLRVYEQMQRLRELLDNIVESVPHGILAVGLDDAVIACNRNSEMLFGIQRIEALNQRYRDAFPKDLAETLSSLILGLLQDGVARDAEFQRKLSAEECLTVGISCSMLRDKEGKPQGFLFICRDLSLSMEVQKLREVDRMKSEFVHTVSHELKTPLTAILGGVEVLQAERESLPEDLREMVDIVETGGKRLHALILDLLDLSRLESGRIGLEREETDLGAVLEEAVHNVRHKNPKCALATEIGELPNVFVDGDKLRQVFENFVGNALKYSPAGGDVTVRLRKEGERIRFEVEDHGLGIAPEHLPNLFEKFYRVDSSTTAQIEGTGLGLAIVKHIVELHEGEVTVKSELGKGSTFGFIIPLVLPSV